MTTISIPVTKGRFGPVDGCIVNWACTDGQAGTLTWRPNQNNQTIVLEKPTQAGHKVTLSSPSRCTLGAIAEIQIGTYDADTLAYIRAWTSLPSWSVADAVAAFIAGLKTDGTWSKFDALYPFKGCADARGVNLVKPGTYNCTAVNNPIFSAAGVKGDGSTSYLDSNFDPTTASGAKFALNDSFLFLWSATESQSNAYDIGNDNARIGARSTGGNMQTRSNQASGSTTAVPSSVGMFDWSRANSTGYARHYNGAAVAASTGNSTGHAAQTFRLCGANGASPQYSGRQIEFAGWGSHLTDGEVANLYGRLSTFRAAV
jgi:hypothetical protein